MPQAKNTVSVMFELTNSLFVVNCSLKMKWKRFCFLKGEILSCSYNQFNVFDTCSILQVLAKELAVFGIMVKRWYGDIYEIVCDEINNGLKLIPKLTLEHVQLNPYSIMKVHSATQVLSEIVNNILSIYYLDAAHATAEFCKFMDMFFDCLNVRCQYEGNTKKKEYLKPYR